MTIGQFVTKYAIKAAGLAGAGMLLYDAHKEGKRVADYTVKKRNADAALDWFDNTRNLHQPSHINMKLKDKIFNLELQNNVREFFNTGIGYVKGFGSMMLYDVVPWALSAAALLTKGPSATCKGTMAKASGIGLGLYAIYAFAKNVCGLGVSSKQ
jgi:hypothetical protein